MSLTLRLICGYLLRSLLPFLTFILWNITGRLNVHIITLGYYILSAVLLAPAGVRAKQSPRASPAVHDSNEPFSFSPLRWDGMTAAEAARLAEVQRVSLDRAASRKMAGKVPSFDWRNPLGHPNPHCTNRHHPVGRMRPPTSLRVPCPNPGGVTFSNSIALSHPGARKNFSGSNRNAALTPTLGSIPRVKVRRAEAMAQAMAARRWANRPASADAGLTACYPG